jgi:hypothetical protein
MASGLWFALAHVEKGVAGHYGTSTEVGQRAELMAKWSAFCTTRP